jgi:dienelactone hydrolase
MRVNCRPPRLSAALAVLVLWGMVATVGAQELLRIPTKAPNAGRDHVEAVLGLPAGPASDKPAPAVILLHAGGGWEVPVTGQYAAALNRAGFVSLELRLFRNEAERAPSRMGYLQNLYDALDFLRARPGIDPQRISVAGYSFGGIMTLTAATAWAQERFASAPDVKFAAHAAFYPVCWGYAAFAKARKATAELPADLLVRWTGARMRIFAGGKDDYDNRDPKACEEFVSQVPEPQRAAFSVVVYPDATHGWDQPTASFYEPLGCKGRGCMNRNMADKEITAKSIQALIDFLSAPGR